MGHLSTSEEGNGWFSHRIRVAVAVAVLPCFLATTVVADARKIAIRSPQVSTEPVKPLLLLVSIKKQRIHIYDADGEVTSSRISSGKPGFDTPTGVFSILEKKPMHHSNIYDNAEMPFMQRITWSGIALHAGVVPGYRASHGCIRLPYSFARSLFDITKVANRVVVTGEETLPIAYNHPRLFRPLPADEASAMKSGALTQRRVAANDQGVDPSHDGLSEGPRLIGFSPELARAVAEMPREPRRPTNRAEADRLFAEKVTRAQQALQAAEAARIATTDKAKIAVKDFDVAKDRYDAARRTTEPVRAAVAAAEKRQSDAVRAFQDFMTAQLSSTGAGTKDAESREADLEDAVLDLTIDADAARADAAQSDMQFAEVQGGMSAAQSARDAAYSAVQQAQITLRTAQTALIEVNKEIVRRNKPVSVFVSLANQRIYVRQGFEAVLDAPISVTPLTGRIGTHVFTAMRYSSDPNTFDWRLVSAHTPLPGQAFDDNPSKKKKQKYLASPMSVSLNVQMATAALESFTIPDDVMATITELARPGASLIISDRGLPPNENGLGTEFVLLTR